ncbi:MAG: hypothetical protein WCF67_08560 [Chitinophagaceae bacterium]
MKLLVSCIAIAILSAFSMPNRIEYSPENNNFSQQILRERMITFEFSMNGCDYEFTIFYDDATGNGHGYIMRDCGNGPRIIKFKVKNVGVTSVRVSDITEMIYDDDSTTPPEASDEDFLEEVINSINSRT